MGKPQSNFQYRTIFGVPLIAGNVLHKTSKGMRAMNYQDTTQFERANNLQLPTQPLLVLCGVSGCPYLIIHLKT